MTNAFRQVITGLAMAFVVAVAVSVLSTALGLTGVLSTNFASFASFATAAASVAILIVICAIAAPRFWRA